ncbi:unnamed protein product, partial [marine sediment metagenome]
TSLQLLAFISPAKPAIIKPTAEANSTTVIVLIHIYI